MKEDYEDIIMLEHPVSADRPHLSMEMRAAQFSPFAALTGFEEVIGKTQEKAKEKFT